MTKLTTAKDINEAHRLAKECAETAIEHALRCGELLIAQKDTLRGAAGHGSWESWVEKNCEFSLRMAQRYMQAAKSVTRDAFPSLRQALGYDKPKAKPVTPEPQVMNPPESAAQGSEAGNLHTAHVMGIGDVHRAAEARPAEAAPPSLTPPPEFDFDGYEPEDDDDFRRNIENVLMADDKLAAMTDQLKQCHREIQALKASRDHYQSQAGEAVRLVKARDREIERLKRQIAKQAA